MQPGGQVGIVKPPLDHKVDLTSHSLLTPFPGSSLSTSLIALPFLTPPLRSTRLQCSSVAKRLPCQPPRESKQPGGPFARTRDTRVKPVVPSLRGRIAVAPTFPPLPPSLIPPNAVQPSPSLARSSHPPTTSLPLIHPPTRQSTHSPSLPHTFPSSLPPSLPLSLPPCRHSNPPCPPSLLSLPLPPSCPPPPTLGLLALLPRPSWSFSLHPFSRCDYQERTLATYGRSGGNLEGWTWQPSSICFPIRAKSSCGGGEGRGRGKE